MILGVIFDRPHSLKITPSLAIRSSICGAPAVEHPFRICPLHRNRQSPRRLLCCTRRIPFSDARRGVKCGAGNVLVLNQMAKVQIAKKTVPCRTVSLTPRKFGSRTSAWWCGIVKGPLLKASLRAHHSEASYKGHLLQQAFMGPVSSSSFLIVITIPPPRLLHPDPVSANPRFGTAS